MTDGLAWLSFTAVIALHEREAGRMNDMSRANAEAYASGKVIDADEEEIWFEITYRPPKNSKN